MAGGFTDEGLAAFDAALARHTSSGAVPGLVALVAQGGQVHVTTAGHAALGDSAPIGRDAIFRIASLTKPIIGVAAMLLIEDGAMALSDPVDKWLPELAGRPVLRAWDAELSDTVPARRAEGLEVECLLSLDDRQGLWREDGPEAEPERQHVLDRDRPPRWHRVGQFRVPGP
jgi:CubicO group peptidase (beta-lactamase class C family)